MTFTITEENVTPLPQPLKPKANGRIATLEAKVAELETKVDTMVWLHAELMYNVKLSAAQQVLNTPAVQDRIKQMIAERLPGLT